MAKKVDDIKRQTDFETAFLSWFDAPGAAGHSLRSILEDNRRRYRMQLTSADLRERQKRGLSAIPPTKATSTVDRAVEKAVMEYHGEPDAISFTAKAGSNDIDLEKKARWLTELFNYRSKYTFPFFTWHVASITAGLSDGLEAALVYWRKESYTKKRRAYFAKNLDGTMDEIGQEEYVLGSETFPDLFSEDLVDEEVVSRDTWWIDSLKPGENLLWDFKAPIFDINLGEVCLVKAPKSLQEIRDLHDAGVFDKFKEEEVKARLRVQSETVDKSSTVADPESVSLDEFDRAEVWIFWTKEKNRWMVQFSIEGKLPLSSKKPSDEVFFNGRDVNRLPIAFGTHRLKLWENIGRGEPEVLAPLDDERCAHKNNVLDAAKLAIQGRWRVDEDTDINLDDLLNNRVFRADKGTFDKIDQDISIIDTLRAIDGLDSDMAELVPVGMENRNIVPRGAARTLGAIQMGASRQDEKLSVGLITRNETFMAPLLYLIAQLEFAFESDDTILKIAGKKANMPVPMIPGADGQAVVDLSELDFDFNVQINAGLGSQPRHEKANTLIQMADWRLTHGIPTDMAQIAAQLNVLAGYDAEAFNTQPPPPKPPEIKGNVNIDLNLLPAEIQAKILATFLSGNDGIMINAQGRTQTGGKQQGQNGRMAETAPGDDGGLGPGGIPKGGQGGWD